MSQKELYHRFKLAMGLDDALIAFGVKVNNLLIHGPKFKDYAFSLELAYLLCNELGISYQTGKYLGSGMLNDLTFKESLVTYQAILDILWRTKNTDLAFRFGKSIETAIVESPVELGIGIRLAENTCPNIHWAGSPLLDEVVEDVLGLLQDPTRSAIAAGFNKSLKEMLAAGGDSERLRNAIRDMQVSCDEVVKWTFSDRGLGFAHLFKENRIEFLGLHASQRQMFFHFNDWMDKAVKHSAVEAITRGDAEFAIYVGSILIRMIIHRARETGLPRSPA